MRITLTAASAALLATVIAAPAMAEPKSAPRPPIVGTETRESRDADTAICVKKTPTGSRVVRKVCKTQAEWKAEGLDPLAK